MLMSELNCIHKRCNCGIAQNSMPRLIRSQKKGIIKHVNQNKKTKPKEFKEKCTCDQENDGVSNPSPTNVVHDALKHFYGDTKFQEKLK